MRSEEAEGGGVCGERGEGEGRGNRCYVRRSTPMCSEGREGGRGREGLRSDRRVGGGPTGMVSA